MILFTTRRGCAGRKEDMMKLNIQAITKAYGCCVYAEIVLPEYYTMNMVVREIKRLGYSHFRIIDTMKKFVAV